jgi:hypothetical protein
MEKLLNNLLKYKWLSMAIILAISEFFVLEMKENIRMETSLEN